eukprot:387759-Prymnesium_polylepis.1
MCDDESGFAADEESDALEDLLGLDGGGELDSLAQGDGGDDDDLAAALAEDGVDDGELAVRFDRQESQVSELQESESEDNVEIPISDEELSSATKLDFSGLNLSGAQARRVAQVVANNSALSTIQFDGHELPIGDLFEEDELEWDSEEYTDVEAIIIAEILKKDKSAVKRLDLARNQITDDGAKALAQMLATNSTLEYLNLESNMISEKGVLGSVLPAWSGFWPGSARKFDVAGPVGLAFVSDVSNACGTARDEEIYSITTKSRRQSSYETTRCTAGQVQRSPPGQKRRGEEMRKGMRRCAEYWRYMDILCDGGRGAHAAGTVEALEICVFGWSGHVVVKPGWYTQVGGGATVPPLYDTR